MSGATAAASRAPSPAEPTATRNESAGGHVPSADPPGMQHKIGLAAFALLLIGPGCGRSTLMGNGAEGTIEYAMSFPDLAPDGLMTDMLPEKAILTFNHDHQALDLSAGMGVFKTSMVVNTPAQVVDYHMSVMGKALVAEFKRRDFTLLNKSAAPMAVIRTYARDTIAGLPCMQAFLLYNNIEMPEAEVWYTEAIPQESPNWYGPYSEIPGVLMRYEVVQHNIRMRLEATSVKLGPVDGSKFTVHPDYQQVSPAVLYAQLDEVLGVFNN